MNVSDVLGSLEKTEQNLVAAARAKIGSRSGPREIALQTQLGPLANRTLDRVIVEAADPRYRSEAIVLAEVRPPLLVQDDIFVVPDGLLDGVRKPLIDLRDSKKFMKGLKTAITLSGRISFLNVPGREHHGTGWIAQINKDGTATVVTNRHVAEAFAYADRHGGYGFKLLPNYDEMALELDLKKEHQRPDRLPVAIGKVLYMAPPRSPDIALLQVSGEAIGALSIPTEWPVTRSIGPETQIAVVGYPGSGGNEDPADLFAYFNGIFGVKRFGVGKILEATTKDAGQFTHDATTLGGNSGSVIVDTTDGAVVGLHFGGISGTANYAVHIEEVKKALNGLSSRSVMIGAPQAINEAVSDRGKFRKRDGYRVDFLGMGAVPPPLPPVLDDVLASATDDDTGAQTYELKYRHFSVWMNRARKLAMVTAVNIDGSQSKRLGRADKWFLDHRLDRQFQVDDAAYKNNALDRGHLVRREDPMWGDVEIAEEANEDSFCFTNAAPQHEGLNQQDWRRLEDYVLSAARVRGLKLSVFTGPVFADTDPLYRKIVRIPLSFWKIIAVVDNRTDALSVTGYVLTQGDLIHTVTNEYVYGAFLTYQLPVSKIGELTGFGVEHLAKHDPLSKHAVQEGASPLAFRAIRGPDDLSL